MSDLQDRFWVARFLCPRCGGTTSCLPSFALPYRYVRVITVVAFMAGEERDGGVQRHWDLLRRYWKGFLRWWFKLAQGAGMCFGSRVWRTARDFWEGMMDFCGGLESASHGLVWEFGMGVFFRYRVHAWARRSRCGVGICRPAPSCGGRQLLPCRHPPETLARMVIQKRVDPLEFRHPTHR